ncbi:uncharacterized protein LOC128203001 [Mya arenaria]|uniref:uncharacterized protein LOC128203001 n=1 Tax=Mya arenaria TaxID=6604 RepID=UPI0022E88581|nr:uncharacterized protein LOC128203001 [Mya arenaria]XP_052760192.1 uncharacterized protein LOC128203001 [Mya arenaria]XP_052760193.1 uncharacterized protein LOC128203001 [Mya arenaria]XP_052760194.1 uncharacterized protein LOC128203001 [Mya arenaria]XP_052760195.1 uncharacterized protein LOC128203001 [Mya arenaria]XP_052760197.1 uncharacterized protein LOC128203001 [Mya arenaria]
MTTETTDLLSNSSQKGHHWTTTHNWNTTLNWNSTVNWDPNMNSTKYDIDQSMNGSVTLEPEYGLAGDITSNPENTTYHPIEMYDDYFYPGFSFEKPIYQIIWEVMVIVTALVNVLVIVVLLRKNMRSRTNMILTAIAFADTLTGVVTLPTYIMAYQKFVPAQQFNSSEYGGLYYDNDMEVTTVSVPNATLPATSNNYVEDNSFNQYDVYVLSKTLCTWFMLTKFFLSKIFHTMSIFLTLFLGFQRFMSVAYPFIAKKTTMKSTIVTCIVIFTFSPVLHIYHVVNEKAQEGMCEWKLENCEGDCVFLWIVLIFRHFVPCTLLTVFTLLFVRELNKSRRIGGNREQNARRERENRRATIIVIAIVIVFLIPEIPYGIFLLFSVISRHTNKKFDLEKNRLIHAIYELTLIASFHVNFYIYTFLNKRFREGLKRTIVYPVQTLFGRTYRWSVSRSQTGRTSESPGRTLNSSLSSKNETMLRQMNPGQVGKALNEDSNLTETKLTNGTSVSTDSKNE